MGIDLNLKSRQSFLPKIPYVPVETSEKIGWKDIVLDRYLLQPNELDIPALSEHVLFINLAHKFEFEDLNRERPELVFFRQSDVAITPVGLPQHWRWHSDFDALNLFISPTLIEEVSKDIIKGDGGSICLMECNGIAAPLISAIGLELLRELETGCINGKTYVDTLTQALAAHLIVHHSTAKCTSTSTLVQPDNARVRCAVDFIEAHLGEQLSLPIIASACNLSVSHLCAVFKHTVGMSVHQFVIHRRVERAKILLKSSRNHFLRLHMKLAFPAKRISQPSFVECAELHLINTKIKDVTTLKFGGAVFAMLPLNQLGTHTEYVVDKASILLRSLPF
jgi:AraC family transcriptional regulator